MEGERDRLGEFMKLLERAKEDIYFAARDPGADRETQRTAQKDRPARSRSNRAPLSEMSRHTDQLHVYETSAQSLPGVRWCLVQ
jgi:hypothetical protein